MTEYVLTIDVRGPGHADRVDVISEKLEELIPTWEDCGGVLFERYTIDGGDFVEYRLDHIVSRKLSHRRKEPEGRGDAQPVSMPRILSAPVGGDRP